MSWLLLEPLLLSEVVPALFAVLVEDAVVIKGERGLVAVVVVDFTREPLLQGRGRQRLSATIQKSVFYARGRPEHH